MSDNQKGILLEAGTNELEVLVFTLGDLSCGVNVAKVREVIGQAKAVRVPGAHPAVVGVSNLRGRVIPLVDLQLYFRPGSPSAAAQRHVIITEFNNLLMGFIVDGVEQIYRLDWQDVEPAPVNAAQQNAAVTSVCHVGDRIVLMIDFEKIAFDIQGRELAAPALEPAPAAAARSVKRLLLAEDSPTMRRYIVQTLASAGYRQVTVTGDGAEAWSELERSAGQQGAPPFDLVVSDIEMPRMDGLHLCRRIREDARLNTMPVVIFSSLVSSDNEKKMSAVGANVTLTKPQLVRLVEVIDGLLASQPGPT